MTHCKTNAQFEQLGYINLSAGDHKLSIALFNNLVINKKYLCLYNDNVYKGLCSDADEIYNVIVSWDYKSFAYIQRQYETNTIDLVVYSINMQDMSIDLMSLITLDVELCDTEDQHYILFSPDNKYVIFKCEWNHVYIINLFTYERTEFYIPNTRTNMNPQVLSVCKDNYIVWYGYDEYVRIIDLSTSPVIWRDKMIYTIRDYQLQTKYFIPLPGNYLLYMDKYNKTTILKINNAKQKLEFVYDIVYPAIGYDDLYINDDSICFTSDLYNCIVNLVDKSCRITKKIKP